MNLEIDVDGFSGYISVWKVYFGNSVWSSIYYNTGSLKLLDFCHAISLVQDLSFNCNLKCVCTLALCYTIMTDESSRKPMNVGVSVNGRAVTRSGKILYNNRVKRSRVDESESDTSERFKPAKMLPQDLDGNCQDKTNGGPSVWKRRDSFSSCSSDSAVYCSSRHAQVDPCSQDVNQNHRTEEVNGKKRHRNSSGSSALSSGSESSNKEASHVTNILNCLEQSSTCTEQSFTELDSGIGSKVNENSLSPHFPVTVTSESKITTFVEQSVSYTCQSTPTNERFHNLRRQIRKKTCHNCDCNGSHTTVVVRRYTQIKQSSTNHGLSKVKSMRVLPKPQKLFTPQPDKNGDSSQHRPSPSQKEHLSRRRRTEVDKLYDALHEIQWAKHISPDNILTQIDIRRAATVSVYSGKDRGSALPKFKSPQCPKTNSFPAKSEKKVSPKACFNSMKSPGTPRSTRSSRFRNNSMNYNNDSPKGKATCKKQDVPVHPSVNNLENGCDISIPAPTIEKLVPINNTSDETDSVQEDNQSVSSVIVEEPGSPISLTEDDQDSNCSTKEQADEEEVKTVPDDQILTTIEEAIEQYALVDDNGCIMAMVDNPDELLNLIPNSEFIGADSAGISHLVSETEIQVVNVGEEVIFEDMYPDIVDVETTYVCTEEVKAQETVISPNLPILSRIEPLAMHTSSDSPPQLEPVMTAVAPYNAHNAKSNSSPDSPPALYGPIALGYPVNEAHLREFSSPSKKMGVSSRELISTDVSEVIETKITTTPLRKTQHVKRCRTIHKQNRKNSIKTIKNVLRKYFNKPKPRLKQQSKSPERQLGDDLSEKSLAVATVSPSAVLPKNPNPLPVGTLDHEEQKKFLESDSLRVVLHDLNKQPFNEHVQCYNRVYTSEDGSITCSAMQRSEVTSSSNKCVQITKQALQYKSCSVQEREEKTKPVKRRELPALEYKKDVSYMPCNFTVHYKSITVNKNDGYTQIILKITQGHNIYLSSNALNELRDALNSANNDPECQVLVLNSIGKSFCMGLDLRPLIEPQKHSASKEMVFAVKNFIEALATLNKPLVVVVNGAAVGLGVTMLCYSDIIISSESASFYMPYNRLGFTPEGGATLMLPFVVGSTVAMDMLLRGRRLSAHEACGVGLVSEVLTASRLPRRLVERVRQLAESPGSALETTKAMLRMHLYQRLSSALENETTLLPDQWMSDACQTVLHRMFQKNYCA